MSTWRFNPKKCVFFLSWTNILPRLLVWWNFKPFQNYHAVVGASLTQGISKVGMSTSQFNPQKVCFFSSCKTYRITSDVNWLMFSQKTYIYCARSTVAQLLILHFLWPQGSYRSLACVRDTYGQPWILQLLATGTKMFLPNSALNF